MKVVILEAKYVYTSFRLHLRGKNTLLLLYAACIPPTLDIPWPYTPPAVYPLRCIPLDRSSDESEPDSDEFSREYLLKTAHNQIPIPWRVLLYQYMPKDVQQYHAHFGETKTSRNFFGSPPSLNEASRTDQRGLRRGKLCTASATSRVQWFEVEC